MSEFDWANFLPEFTEEALRQGFSCECLAEFPGGPLMAYERKGPGRKVYLSAGIHGDEAAGPLGLMELLKSGALDPGLHWMICPAINPDGLAAGSRENAQGLDLNRDYLVRSSGEIEAHARWLESMPTPDLFISLHEDWEAAGFYLYEINLGQDRPDRIAAVVDAVEDWFGPESAGEIDGHEARGPGWIFHAAEADVPEGWPEAIFLAKRGCPLSFTLETPSHAEIPRRVGAQVAAVKALLGSI